jgi:hypothetical protein
VFEPALAHAAVFLGNMQPAKVGFGQMPQGIPREFFFFVQFGPNGQNFFFGHLTRQVLDHQLFFGQQIVHNSPPSTRMPKFEGRRLPAIAFSFMN